MNVLILTGKFGMGHWSASQSLRRQLLEEEPDGRAEVVDFMDYAIPSMSEAMYKAFALLVTHGSGIFNTYYKITENLSMETRPMFEGHFFEKLEELLEAYQPDAIIATHPLCANVVSCYKEETGSSLPLVTCITDLTAHSEWINRHTDLYLVGTPEISDSLAQKGVAQECIVAAGIPVRPEFQTTPHRRGGEVRRLLIMGGGLGLLPKKDKFYEALNSMAGVETTIIAGRNEKLRARLSGKYEHITVLGYTDKVYEHMAQADLMLSKPGGITLFESISAELPILAWEPFLQQEINNGRFLARAGIGAIAAKETEDCLASIADLIYNDGALRWMAANMRRLKARLSDAPLTALLAALMAGKAVCA